MRRMLLIGAGAAVGYVMGARAGRPAYDRIVTTWGRTAQALGLADMSQSMGRSASDLRDAARDRASSEVGDLMDRAKDAVAPEGAAPQRNHGEHATLVAPTPSSLNDEGRVP